MTLPGWTVEHPDSGQVLYTSPCGRVRVQDSRRRTQARFNVIAFMQPQAVVDGVLLDVGDPAWLEVTAVASARAAAASARQTCDAMKPSSSAASQASATPVS